tara:strand:+ start:145 stop:624 length:480 start_codon:yes stop_codon:yes gene_type:complete
MLFIYIFFSVILYSFIGNYLYYIPIFILYHNYYKNTKLLKLKDETKTNKIIIFYFKYINLDFNKSDCNNYYENKIILFKNKYHKDTLLKNYDIRDKFTIYICKFDGYFYKFINEILLFILFYFKLLFKYYVSQQFSNNNNNNLNYRKQNLLNKINNKKL